MVNKNTKTDTFYINMFSYIFLMLSSDEQFLVLTKSNLSIVLFYCWCLLYLSRKWLSTPNAHRDSQINIYLQRDRSLGSFFPHTNFQSIQRELVKTFPSPLKQPCIFVKYQPTVCVRSSLFCSARLFVLLAPKPNCLNYSSFAVNVKIKQ